MKTIFNSKKFSANCSFRGAFYGTFLSGTMFDWVISREISAKSIKTEKVGAWLSKVIKFSKAVNIVENVRGFKAVCLVVDDTNGFWRAMLS